MHEVRAISTRTKQARYGTLLPAGCKQENWQQQQQQPPPEGGQPGLASAGSGPGSRFPRPGMPMPPRGPPFQPYPRPFQQGTLADPLPSLVLESLCSVLCCRCHDHKHDLVIAGLAFPCHPKTHLINHILHVLSPGPLTASLAE